jgi:hypothetical protein
MISRRLADHHALQLIPTYKRITEELAQSMEALLSFSNHAVESCSAGTQMLSRKYDLVML